MVPKKHPSPDPTEFDRLRAERDDLARELAEIRRSFQVVSTQIARQNERLDEVVGMLRRRESQLRGVPSESRNLRRKLGLEDDDPEPASTETATPVSWSSRR